jgi:hypothetical protein
MPFTAGTSNSYNSKFLNTTDAIGVIVQANSTQTKDLQEWNNSSGTVLNVVDHSGNVGIGTSAPGTMLDVHGSFSLPITTVTANYTVGANDYTVLCNNSVSITITLPTAAGISGRIIVIKKLTATSTTIDGYGSETIDGATTVVSTTQWLSWMLQSNGTAWFVLANK